MKVAYSQGHNRESGSPRSVTGCLAAMLRRRGHCWAVSLAPRSRLGMPRREGLVLPVDLICNQAALPLHNHQVEFTGS